MGCDIHPIVQVLKNNEWTSIESPRPSGHKNPIWAGLCGRNYDLFAVLADVRNGFGFAGVLTGERITPISEPRGLPDDFNAEEQSSSVAKYPDCDFWIGDHSFSWLLLKELNTYNWKMDHIKTGVITRKQYEAWDKISPPESWSGHVWGRDVVCTITPTEDYTHIQVTWHQTIGERCKEFVEHTLPWLNSLGKDDEVRLVFGFDS